MTSVRVEEPLRRAVGPPTTEGPARLWRKGGRGEKKDAKTLDID